MNLLHGLIRGNHLLGRTWLAGRNPVETASDAVESPVPAPVPIAPPPPPDQVLDDDALLKNQELLNAVARESLNRELDRAKRKEESAARYGAFVLAFLALLGSLVWPLVRETIPPTDRFQWVILGAGGLFFASILAAAVCIIATLKPVPLKEPRIGDEITHCARTESPVRFLNSMALGYRDAVADNERRTDQRADCLARAHPFVLAALASFVVCILAWVVREWVR
jgi:hypothetical protein